MQASVYASAEAQYWSQLSAVLPSLLAGNWSAEALQAMQAGGHLLRILLDENEVVAFAEMQWVVDECQLHNIAVFPHRQRKGLGFKLLSALMHEARAAGMNTCVLEVRESNLAACRLYEKAGFVSCGRRPDYYPALSSNNQRETAVLYSCSL